MVIFTVFSERLFQREETLSKKAQFHMLLWIMLLIILDFRWYGRIASVVTIVATGKIYEK
jgi:uncharacterized membrane protein (DUF106 family)